jgi:steroid 5-alpha reductase family enzyme
MDWAAYSYALLPVVLVAVIAWLVSLARNDVSIVDSLWSLMFVLIAITYAWLSESSSARTILVLGLVSLWALRLSVFITVRNHGEPEDHRYQAIRRNNEPGFRFKSLYIVFGLQGLLVAIIAMPLASAMHSSSPLGWLDMVGIGLWLIGMTFEVVGDAQLSRFRSKPENQGKVLDSGIWRFTRHPNYFGEFTLWWGFYLVAVAAGGWWTILSPVLMSFLLLKVSGVSLLEKDIGDRRPAYADYISRTNAFFPGPRRAPLNQEIQRR